MWACLIANFWFLSSRDEKARDLYGALIFLFFSKKGFLCGPFFFVFIEFTASFLFYVLVSFWPRGMWDALPPQLAIKSAPPVLGGSLKLYQTQQIPEALYKGTNSIHETATLMT